MNPLMRLLSWLLRPLRDEHVAALEDELATAQAAVKRAEVERNNALTAVDDLSSRNARLHQENMGLREEIAETGTAIKALAAHRRCCPTGRGEPS